MATFLDVTGLQYFSSFFIFIFVWLIVYAVLLYSKVLGGNKFIHALIGLVLALLVLFSPIATGAIQYIAPWFGLIFVFIILVTVMLKIFGASPMEIEGYTQLKWGALVIILLVLVVGVLSYVREQTVIPGEEDGDIDYSKNISIIFHPKVIGAIFILVIAVFTIALLAGKTR